MSFSSRTHVAPGDLGLAADNNQGMDNEDYLKGETDTLPDLRLGWVAAGETWTYTSATTFTISGDLTAKYQVGDKIRLKQSGSYKYFHIVGVSYGAPNTTITVTGGSDYSVANASITDNYYSRAEHPFGFPDWFNYSPTVTWTNGPTSPTDIAKFRIQRKTVTVLWRRTGTASGSGSTIFTVTVPVDSALFTTADKTYPVEGGTFVTDDATFRAHISPYYFPQSAAADLIRMEFSSVQPTTGGFMATYPL